MGPLVSGDLITSRKGPRYVSGSIFDHSANTSALYFQHVTGVIVHGTPEAFPGLSGTVPGHLLSRE